MNQRNSDKKLGRVRVPLIHRAAWWVGLDACGSTVELGSR